MKLFNKFLIFFSFLVLGLVWEKAVPEKDYNALRQQYISLQENDAAAFDNGLDAFIAKAIKKKNYEKMAQGYDDAIFFTSDRNQKLNYANEAIKNALISKNKDTIGSAYLRKVLFIIIISDNSKSTKRIFAGLQIFRKFK
jgi:aspartyl-tRNA synthetase